jgi:hypothetical protein
MIDIEKFRSAVMKEDLARANMFRVEFSQKIGKGSGGGSGKKPGLFSQGGLIGGIAEAVGKEILARSSVARRISGFYSPEIMRAIGLGDMLDKYLQYPYDLGMYVKDVQLPGRVLDVIDTNQDQVVHAMVNGSTFDPITMQFIVTPSQKERQFFLDWMNKANNMETNKFGFYDDYVSNIIVKIYNRQGEMASVVEVVEAFPVRVSEMSMSYDSNNQLAVFDVTFRYKKSTTKQSSDDGDGNIFTEARHWYDSIKRIGKIL